MAPFGAWKSPITPDLIVAETVMLREVAVDGPVVYWLEQRGIERILSFDQGFDRYPHVQRLTSA